MFLFAISQKVQLGDMVITPRQLEGAGMVGSEGRYLR